MLAGGIGVGWLTSGGAVAEMHYTPNMNGSNGIHSAKKRLIMV